ncbi:SKP1 [Cordylochernes scorpioides]|uniref:SKP1 n=1 Tax=Cordylochernes scorpioides TaxID=51811 RepID=A0ABY6KJE3_9ARAC|nr:SKP1 [Cordylochernes scorpioides]
MVIARLQSKDGDIFIIDVDVAKRSNTLKLAIEMSKIDLDDDVIPIENITSNVLKPIIDWLTYHKDDEPSEPIKILKAKPYYISNWDKEFLKMDLKLLYEIMNAAHFLDIKDLVDLGCKHIANIIKISSHEELTEIFEFEATPILLTELEQIENM